jgi:hypothetical protein
MRPGQKHFSPSERREQHSSKRALTFSLLALALAMYLLTSRFLASRASGNFGVCLDNF